MMTNKIEKIAKFKNQETKFKTSTNNAYQTYDSHS